MEEVKQIDQTLKSDARNVERRSYYKKNQKKILAYQSKLLECECGCEVTRSGIYRHRTSKKHVSRMEAIDKMWVDKEDDEEDEEILWTRIDCACCAKSIKRDSREHDECLIIDDVLYCADCC